MNKSIECISTDMDKLLLELREGLNNLFQEGSYEYDYTHDFIEYIDQFITTNYALISTGDPLINNRLTKIFGLIMSKQSLLHEIHYTRMLHPLTYIWRACLFYDDGNPWNKQFINMFSTHAQNMKVDISVIVTKCVETIDSVDAIEQLLTCQVDNPIPAFLLACIKCRYNILPILINLCMQKGHIYLIEDYLNFVIIQHNEYKKSITINPRVIEILIEHDIRIKNIDNIFAISLATGSVDVIQFLLLKGYTFNPKNYTTDIKHMISNSFESVKSFKVLQNIIDSGTDVIDLFSFFLEDYFTTGYLSFFMVFVDNGLNVDDIQKLLNIHKK